MICVPAIAAACSVFSFTGFSNFALLSYSPDAQTYLSVSEWLLGNGSAENLMIRPYGYPAFLSAISFGLKLQPLIFYVQWLLATASCYLLFCFLKKTTQRNYLAWVGLLLMASNLSLWTHTQHALSEVLCIFLVMLWMYNFTLKTPQYSLFILGLLTVVKPVFFMAFAANALAKTIAWKRPGQFDVGGVVFVGMQFTLMLVLFGKPAISSIGSETLNRYFYAYTYSQIHNLELEEARGEVAGHSTLQMAKALLPHPTEVANSYYTLLKNHNYTHTPWLQQPIWHAPPNRYMLTWNRNAWYVHLTFLPLTGILLLYWRFRGREIKSSWVHPYLMLLYLFLTTGLSFGQGDRLALLYLPIAIGVYVQCVAKLRRRNKNLSL